MIPGLTARVIAQLAERAPLADVVAHPDEHADLVAEAGLAALRTGRAAERADQEAAAAARLGIAIVALGDTRYPTLLRASTTRRPSSTCAGTLAEDERRGPVAVVGSARPRRRWTVPRPRHGARPRGLAAATVVSGLARGIDTAAHEGALEADGRPWRSWAAASIGPIRPRTSGSRRRITAKGAVVSEFPLGTPRSPEHFPRRNRVIAGWSHAVVVVEAAVRSGALNTARCAADEGRDVLAVPGHPTQPASAGTNQLIRDGAGLVRSRAGRGAGAGPRADRTRRRRPPIPCWAPSSGPRPRPWRSCAIAAALKRERSWRVSPTWPGDARHGAPVLPGPLFVRHHQSR